MKDNFAHRAAEWDTPDKVKMTEVFVAEMLQHVDPQPHWKALEIGAGTGLVGLQIADKVNRIVFEDTSAAMLEVLKEKLDENSNCETLHGEVFDYREQDIDFVFACMSLHHVPDIEETLCHLSSITKPGGIVVIGDLRSEDGSFHRFEPIPHQGFDTDILTEQFREVGFDVQIAHTYHVLTRERVEGVITDFEQFILVARKR